jgi:hypothetical protein
MAEKQFKKRNSFFWDGRALKKNDFEIFALPQQIHPVPQSA